MNIMIWNTPTQVVFSALRMHETKKAGAPTSGRKLLYFGYLLVGFIKGFDVLYTVLYTHTHIRI